MKSALAILLILLGASKAEFQNIAPKPRRATEEEQQFEATGSHPRTSKMIHETVFDVHEVRQEAPTKQSFY
jgi:hypothetical protein